MIKKFHLFLDKHKRLWYNKGIIREDDNMNKERYYKNLEIMTLEEYDKYLAEKENGYITIKSHPEDENLVILNYTDSVTYEKRWNKETMSARGLILDLTYAKDNGIIYVLAKPFEKFFNYGENLDYEKDIDFTKVETVMEKMDGSLGISYLINGELRFATRGSFTSDQALRATKIWKRKYQEARVKYWKMFEDSLPSLMVEIIYPENKIVVDYNGEEKLVLLGITEGHKDYDYEDVKYIGEYMRLPVVPQYELTIEKMLEMRKTISANEEGWILRFEDGKRLKIKGEEYLQVHRLLCGLSDKAKFKAWADGKLDEYIMKLPEEFRHELESFGHSLDVRADALNRGLSFTYLLARRGRNDVKDFAIYVNEYIKPEYRRFMFEAFKIGHINMASVKDYIFKNYRDYVGG